MRGYIKGLDGLRAVAILWVMLGHISAASQLSGDSTSLKFIKLFAGMGWGGVQLFFVISGFLITKILLENKGSTGQVRNFYIRRSLRIFPVYYFTLGVAFILLPLLGLNLYWLVEDTENQVWFWTYLNNWVRPFTHSKAFPHLWSLAIEEQYYLIWPFVVIFLDRRWLIRICILMILSAPIFRFVLFYWYEPEIAGLGARAAYNFTFARWDALALGSLLAVLLRDPVQRDFLKANANKILFFSLSMIFVQLGFSRTFNAIGKGGFELINQSSSALLFLVIVFYVVKGQKGRGVKLLEMTPLKLIGKYSYAMYIFHLPLMIVWFEYFVPELSFLVGINLLFQLFFHFAVVLIVTYLLALLSWILLEHPILKLKHQFGSK